MGMNRLLDGENVRPRTAAQARSLIGKRLEYLRESDIDRSGRGYIFPRRGTFKEVIGRNVEVEGTGGHDWVSISSFVEVRLIDDEPPK